MVRTRRRNSGHGSHPVCVTRRLEMPSVISSSARKLPPSLRPDDSSNSTGTRSRRASSMAPASSTRAGAASAASSSSAARSTEASARRPTLPILTAPKHTADSMLALPRPTTRAACGQEARPCPWVGCRHHLLLEVAQSNGVGSTTAAGKPRDLRPTSLRMNRPNRGRASLGRRPGLESSAAHLVVRRWIDDAAEQLANMMHTCSLDVVDAYPDGLSEASVAILLGVTEQAINAETTNALREYKRRVKRLDSTTRLGEQTRYAGAR